MTGVGRVVFGRSRWGRGKVHWMRVLVIGAHLLWWRALGLIPGGAEWILGGRIRRRSILVVPLRMLRVRVRLREGLGSAHRRDDRGGCWGLGLVILLPLLLTVIGHVYSGM